jgi:hypothetical protein
VGKWQRAFAKQKQAKRKNFHSLIEKIFSLGGRQNKI